jgi:hypothetical protein
MKTQESGEVVAMAAPAKRLSMAALTKRLSYEVLVQMLMVAAVCFMMLLWSTQSSVVAQTLQPAAARHSGSCCGADEGLEGLTYR